MSWRWWIGRYYLHRLCQCMWPCWQLYYLKKTSVAGILLCIDQVSYRILGVDLAPVLHRRGLDLHRKGFWSFYSFGMDRRHLERNIDLNRFDFRSLWFTRISWGLSFVLTWVEAMRWTAGAVLFSSTTVLFRAFAMDVWIRLVQFKCITGTFILLLKLVMCCWPINTYYSKIHPFAAGYKN